MIADDRADAAEQRIGFVGPTAGSKLLLQPAVEVVAKIPFLGAIVEEFHVMASSRRGLCQRIFRMMMPRHNGSSETFMSR